MILEQLNGLKLHRKDYRNQGKDYNMRKINRDYLKKMWIVAIIVVLGVFFLRICRFCEQLFKKEKKTKEKNRAILKMLSKWMQNKESGKTIETYLKDMDFRTIAIYGMSDAGQRLYDELNGTDIKIAYVMDKRPVDLEDSILRVSIEDELPKVDVIIVTAIYDFPEISETLKQKTESKIISLEQIVYEL